MIEEAAEPDARGPSEAGGEEPKSQDKNRTGMEWTMNNECPTILNNNL